MQERLGSGPVHMRIRRQTAEHPFGNAEGLDGGNTLSDQDVAEGRRNEPHVLAYNISG